MIKKLSIIIPAFNESSTIEQILNEVSNVTLINNIEKRNYSYQRLLYR